jgi:hypothetical protein
VDDLRGSGSTSSGVATTLSVSSQGFEDRAADWIRFARAERHDPYWAYRHAFFEILPSTPAGARDRVRRGAGRDTPFRGYDVTARPRADARRAAHDADPVGRTSSGTLLLPFDDGLFDLVVSYNSLIDVETCRPPSRRPAGCSASEAASAAASRTRSRRRASSKRCRRRSVRRRARIAEADYEAPQRPERDRVPLRRSRRFRWSHTPRAHEAAGLAIEALREPPLPGVESHRRMRMPLFLMWKP